MKHSHERIQELACSIVAAVLMFIAAPRLAWGNDSHDDDDFVPAEPGEPFATEFSLKLAARSLDSSAAAWQRENQCCQCHANFMYLIARPALAEVLAPPPHVRSLFEQLVSERWEKQGLRY